MTEWPSHFRAARTRSPWLLYAAVFASGGIFAWVWVFLLMQDVNRLKRRNVFNTALYFYVFCFGVALYFALIFWPPLPGTVPPGLSPLRLGLILSVGLALLVFPAVVIVQVNNGITTPLSAKSRSLNAIVIVLLTFLMFISLITVQLRLNELIRTRTAQNE
jgi:hypothetical protein